MCCVQTGILAHILIVIAEKRIFCEKFFSFFLSFFFSGKKRNLLPKSQFESQKKEIFCQ